MNTLRIAKIVIEDIRSITRLELDLRVANGTRDWLLLFGDNGTGKTTLLRCIALALGNKDDASGMFKELEGHWVRRGSKSGTGSICVEFDENDEKGQPFSVKITISGKGGNETIASFDTVPEEPNFPVNRIFACGYGAGRGVEGTRTTTKYRLVDAVYSLFDYETPLQNAEVALRRLEDLGPTTRSELTHRLDRVLLLKEGSTTIDSEGLKVVARFDQKYATPFSGLSDGYKSVLTYVSDFFGRSAQFYEKLLPRNSLGGIVLIDEIDQHLHASWQRRIIGLLHEQFPRVQFIACTHTPMCAVGATDLEDDQVELAVLRQDSGNIKLVEDIPLPRGKTANQVFTSILFDLSGTSDDETANRIQRYLQLANRSGESEDLNEELSGLRHEIEEFTRMKQTPLQDIVSSDLLDHIASETVRKIASDPNSPRELQTLLDDDLPIRAEALRQLSILFDESPE